MTARGGNSLQVEGIMADNVLWLYGMNVLGVMYAPLILKRV